MKYANKQFSHATLNPRHILEISLEYLEEGSDLRDYVKEVLSNKYTSLKDEYYDMSDAIHEVFDYLETLAEDGYYFGPLEGDGACFGWWPLGSD